jgi:hypothetical protein
MAVTITVNWGEQKVRIMTLRIERPVPRRGLSRVEAAIYLGISPSKFDELRKVGRIGPAKILDGRKLYAIEMLDVFLTLSLMTVVTRPTTGLSAYERDSLPGDAPPTSAWLRRRP